MRQIRGLFRSPAARATAVAAAVLAVGVGLYAVLSPTESGVDFNAEVRPILNEKCLACHGGVKREGGLSLQYRQAALDTTDSGRRAVVPGRTGESELLRRVTLADPEERMPLHEPPLDDAEIDVLRRWIEDGAPWARHWAYVAPQRAPLPDVSDASWPRGGIDRFVLARLEAEGLAPAPRADCARLLRRVSLDLVGLPPTPADVDDFCRDPSQEAYARAVDRLLASPRYGERWAALWLDLARYADSKGYEKDRPRSNWRYRDWVIDAFNRDLPFDRFTVEQLAGDLLPAPDTSQLLATTFHRNTMTNEEGGTDDEEFRLAAVIDRLNTTWEVWQGTTIACTQCHDHPYDPFRQDEYYELLAFFNNTADADRPDETPLLYEFPDEAADKGRALLARRADVEARIDEAVAAAGEARRGWLRRLEAHAARADRPPRFEDHVVPPHLLRIAARADTARSPNDRAQLTDFFVSVNPSFEALRRELEEVEAEIRALDPVTTPVLRELPPEARRTTHVFERGNWLVRGEEVAPSVPASMPALPEDAPRDRLGLAQWLVSPENPLTARVTVNRLWEQLFGTGLVETVEDLGTKGGRPSHPALLDWLARAFVDTHGWRVKPLLRQVVLSATYQQSARVTPVLLERDPDNRLLARGPRFRLSAEQVRDQALFVSGLLSDEMYGPSVMPPQPEGLWQAPYSSLEWETSEGEDRHRRALYTFWRRTVPYPSMMAFDAPSREVCVSRRVRTNTPLQALVTLNDPVYVEAARALAGRMAAEGGAALPDRLRRGYRLALLRHPAPEDVSTLRALYDDALDRYRTNPAASTAFAGMDDAERAALTVAANALLNLDAFLTKE